jgi:hypothetical protein
MGEEPQGTETKVEGADEATQPEEKATGKTYTEEDFQRAVSKGLESMTKQLSLRDGEVKAAKAEAERLKADYEATTARLEILKKEAEEALVDDPEKREAYISRIKSLEREQEIASKNAEAERKLYEAEKLAWSGAMALKSIELKKKYQVPQEVLDICLTEEDMEKVAKTFPEVGETKEEPKFDTATSTEAGPDWHELTPQEKLLKGLTQKSR